MTQSNASKLEITTPSDLEIQMTRTFNAPRELVFRAMTERDLMALWWGPRRYTTIIEKLEVRPGGQYRLLNRGADGEEYAFRGEFREIVPPERIVWTFEFEGMPGHISVETLTLEERNGQTTITSTSVFDNTEDRDGMLNSGMEEGAAESYDRLEELLPELK
jgi:uncharacterized protein YndB with AHSA1/START domain